MFIQHTPDGNWNAASGAWCSKQKLGRAAASSGLLPAGTSSWVKGMEEALSRSITGVSLWWEKGRCAATHNSNSHVTQPALCTVQCDAGTEHQLCGERGWFVYAYTVAAPEGSLSPCILLNSLRFLLAPPPHTHTNTITLLCGGCCDRLH